MMQSINFYLEEYRPKPLSFDSKFAALAMGIALVMMVVIGVIETTHVSKLEKQLKEKQVELKQISDQVVKLQKQMAESGQVESIEAKIAARQLSLNSYRKILANMSQPTSQTSTRYSEIMKQLGEQKGASVWLTKIQIAAQNLSLQGSTLETKAIPAYVEELKNSATLKRQFDELTVERDAENDRLVNFSLNNGRLTNE